jgi:hypothetical protein
MTSRDVTKVVEIINRHYSRWFHKVYATDDALALDRAKRAALSEVAELKVLLSR